MKWVYILIRNFERTSLAGVHSSHQSLIGAFTSMEAAKARVEQLPTKVSSNDLEGPTMTYWVQTMQLEGKES